MDSPQLTEFGYALLFLLGGFVLMGAGMVTNRLLAPHRPNREKLTSYECGEDPVGSSWLQFNMRFYAVALIFLIFDVEVLLLFPWATVFADATLLRTVPGWGWLALAEAGIFLAILTLGLAYVWRKGDLDWVRPQQLPTSAGAAIPMEAYQAFNARQQATVPQKAP